MPTDPLPYDPSQLGQLDGNGDPKVANNYFWRITKALLAALLPTDDQKDALDGAAVPSAANVFATMADIPGGGSGFTPAYAIMKSSTSLACDSGTSENITFNTDIAKSGLTHSTSADHCVIDTAGLYIISFNSFVSPGSVTANVVHQLATNIKQLTDICSVIVDSTNGATVQLSVVALLAASEEVYVQVQGDLSSGISLADPRFQIARIS
jgi:hypothetical protein